MVSNNINLGNDILSTNNYKFLIEELCLMFNVLNKVGEMDMKQ